MPARIDPGVRRPGLAAAEHPVSTATTYAYVNPIVALFRGWAILSEAITARTNRAAAGTIPERRLRRHGFAALLQIRER
jgi:hypothetical protein